MLSSSVSICTSGHLPIWMMDEGRHPRSYSSLGPKLPAVTAVSIHTLNEAEEEKEKTGMDEEKKKIRFQKKR